MHETNFSSSFLKGIQVSEDKEKNRKEIFALINEMAADVYKASEDRIKIEIIRDSDYKNSVGNLQTVGQIAANLLGFGIVNSAALGVTNQDVYNEATKPDHLNFVIVVRNEENQLKLTDFIFDPQAYPCRFKIDGSDVISRDFSSLERNLHKLLSSAYAGDCFRRLMSR